MYGFLFSQMYAMPIYFGTGRDVSNANPQSHAQNFSHATFPEMKFYQASKNPVSK
jgi:hypothetical protein